MNHEMNLEQILEILPHRYPFLLIDRVLSISDEKTVALKNVTFNEGFFEGHFPAERVMPGVLILEAMAQTAAVHAVMCQPGLKGKVMYLLGFDDARIKRKVVPGDQLRLEAVPDKQRGKMFFFQVKAFVGDDIAAQAKVIASST